ncbi:hypothetical protein HanRHA438_Chr15g0731941 [Helianthus annuus]|uniref:Uncharacterized protein n=1 Tax=Helianthus annuus TaxID=4232 RepID=A0A251SCH2_HELAN|nr:hypothetical protein HanXRQr2_Chr15g0719561 [Helianthus annuus]KAJ0458255.1 hypothetical protein HanIR_Chr15g0783031 [Helianthus annuus]KAJ0833431.1 hypothetical protein HanPSC8_Chr15g0690291 [Helianthus annuus]KAJ0847062.1 hypothetical protein HanRHA438_Chr15g0731941 [Helianthus annuus]
MRQRWPLQSWRVATGFSMLRDWLGLHSTSRPTMGEWFRRWVSEIHVSTNEGVSVTMVEMVWWKNVTS